MHTSVTISETGLSDGSKVHSVHITHGDTQIQLRLMSITETDAIKSAQEIAEVLDRLCMEEIRFGS